MTKNARTPVCDVYPSLMYKYGAMKFWLA